MDFQIIWNRIKENTEITNLNGLAKLVQTSQPNVSKRKKENKFPIEWAYKIGKEYDLNLDWILEGIEPKRASGCDHQEQDTKIFKNDILHQIDEWLSEMVKDDPGRREWFRIDFEDKYPKFAEFKRKGEQYQQYTGVQSEKVA